MNFKFKIILSLLITNFSSIELMAQPLEQKNLIFNFDANSLKKSDISYSMKLLTPEKLKERYPQLVSLDASGLLENKESKVLVSKFVYIVNKPASFFNYHQMVDVNFIKHQYNERKISAIDENSFKSDTQDKFRLDVYYDSDDINYTKKSLVVNAITESKKIDPLSIGSSASVFRHFTYPESLVSENSSLTNYVSISASKTLVIEYTLASIKNGSEKINTDEIKSFQLKEILSHQQSINSFKLE